jgi:adenylate cyclase
LEKARDYFQRAIEKDPNDAMAYVELAEYYSVVGDYTYIPYSEIIPKAKVTAQKALPIDDTLAEGHVVLTHVYDAEWDWANAVREIERALELDPNMSRAHVAYGLHLYTVGNHEQALMLRRYAF